MKTSNKSNFQLTYTYRFLNIRPDCKGGIKWYKENNKISKIFIIWYSIFVTIICHKIQSKLINIPLMTNYKKKEDYQTLLTISNDHISYYNVNYPLLSSMLWNCLLAILFGFLPPKHGYLILKPGFFYMNLKNDIQVNILWLRKHRN